MIGWFRNLWTRIGDWFFFKTYPDPMRLQFYNKAGEVIYDSKEDIFPEDHVIRIDGAWRFDGYTVIHTRPNGEQIHLTIEEEE